MNNRNPYKWEKRNGCTKKSPQCIKTMGKGNNVYEKTINVEKEQKQKKLKSTFSPAAGKNTKNFVV